MKLTLINKKPEVADVATFIFEPEDKITWQPGQFLHYTLPHPNADDRGEKRWFTIAAAPFEGHLQITTRQAEQGSSFKKALFAMELGDTIEADGPEGEFVVDDPEQNHVFIAGGIGITPFRSILLDLDQRGLPLNVKLLYANRDAENVVFKDELEELAAKHPEFSIRYFIDPERIDADAITFEVVDLAEPVFFISGPEPMVDAFNAMLLEMGVPKNHLKQDHFPGYEWQGSKEA
jgi:ferredoxin-NADP reductase